MSQFKPATKETIASVLRKMAEQCESDNDTWAQEYADVMNRILDELVDDDYFGTEGQCDPRGDHRD